MLFICPLYSNAEEEASTQTKDKQILIGDDNVIKVSIESINESLFIKGEPFHVVVEQEEKSMYWFKVVVDILASLAALIAIIAVLVSWKLHSQKPLKIERVVIRKKKDNDTYILVIKNRKPYPVEIESIECFTKRHYCVVTKAQNAEYQKFLNYKYRCFKKCYKENAKFYIEANGDIVIEIEDNKIDGKIHKLLFTINTSHGYHEVWCKNIQEYEIGKTEVYDLKDKKEFESKFIAILVYYCLKIWLKIRHIINYKG